MDEFNLLKKVKTIDIRDPLTPHTLQYKQYHRQSIVVLCV